MQPNRSAVLGAALLIVSAGGAGLWTALAQAPQPSNPSPRPSNPSPRPANPQPRPQDPNTPSRPDEPNQPKQPDRQPRLPDDPARPTPQQTRNLRPFAFENPQMEGSFRQSAQRLVRMEERLAQSNQDLLRRLGEARRLDGERQNEAVMDILQDVLMNQNRLQQYLVQARLAWTGDIETDNATADQPENDR